MIALLPERPGFLPESPYAGGAASLFPGPQTGAEGGNGGFEKVFAEFMSGVSRREAEERAVMAARDRELRVREEAAESMAAEYRAAETLNRRESETVRESAAPSGIEAAAPVADPRETAAPSSTASETGGDGSVPAAEIDGAPAEESAAGEDSLHEEAAETSPFPSPYQNSAAAEDPADAAVNIDIDLAAAAAEPPEGRENPAPYFTAGPASLPPDSPAVSKAKAVAAKGSPAAEKAGSPAEDSPDSAEFPDIPGPGELSPKRPEHSAALHDEERALPLSPAGITQDPAGGFALSGQEDPSGLSPALGRAREEQGAENPREGRGNSRRRVELRDYREKSPESSLAPSLNPAGPPDPALHREGLSPDLLSGDPGPRNGGEGAAAGGEDAATPAGTFEDLLSRELRQHLNSGIVRHAQVVLRDKGEGLIRLSLKPESLGHVKIHLELTENKIAGRIIVESGEALRAFEREIASLEQAFRDSGYESAELNTFLAQDGQGSGGFQGEDRPFYSSRLAADKAASRYDEAVERTDTSFPGLPGDGFGPGNGHIQVNILV